MDLIAQCRDQWIIITLSRFVLPLSCRMSRAVLPAVHLVQDNTPRATGPLEPLDLAALKAFADCLDG
jgi:hypothetical protein